MFTSVLFDLDGTLVDSAADIAASVNFVREYYALPALPRAAVDAAIGDGVRVLLERTLLTEKTVDLNEAVGKYVEHQQKHCLDQTVLYPGGRETIVELSKTAALAVVSNKPTALCVQILNGLGVLQYFRACVGGDTPAGRKPSPKPVERALESLQRTPWDALVVGDSPADLQAGAAAGSAVCAVSYGYRPIDLLMIQKPDYTISDLPSLVKVATAGGGKGNIYEYVGRERFYQLAREFYQRVGNDPRIRGMFPPRLDEAIEHQALFFIQFFGGPSEYNEKRGHPRLRMRHAPFPIDAAARDAWLENMQSAVDAVSLPEPARGIFLRYVKHTAGILVNR